MNRPDSPHSIAITTRLVVSYLVVTLLILFCTNWFQFRALSDDLELEDNDFLVERITSLRSIIARHPDEPALLRDQIPLNDADQHIRYLVRVLDGQGGHIAESPGMSALPVGAFPPPVSTGRRIGQGIKHVTPGNGHFLLNSAWAEGFGNPRFRQVQVALDVTDEVGLMERYIFQMIMSLVAGLLLAGGLAVVITRKGLRPLQEVASTVARITETDLHQRVRTGTWPKELDQLTLALDQMLARLEGSFARLSEFSANLAHELRTPLNNLRGEAEVALSRSRSDEEYRRIIESSIEEYERLSRMVGDILFLARPDQGLSPRMIDARGEVELLGEYYRTFADEHEISITIEGNGTVNADPRLFQRAVGNLISNALHYTSAGGRIEVKITSEPSQVVVAVEDDGMGIAASDLPSVFDRFYRSADARLRHNQGSGLGLAIVRSIMDLHGGSAIVSSHPGRGTLVTLTFPHPAQFPLQ